MALVLDFDGTITLGDTIEVLAQFAVRFQSERGRDLSGAWRDIAAAYMGDCEQYKAGYPIEESQRVSLPVETEFRNGMKELEMASVRRVHDSKLFEGISSSDLRAAGENAVKKGDVKIRSGFDELIALARGRGWSIHVISVNWSKSFIEGVLSGFGTGIRVISNEIVGGKVSGPLPTADADANASGRVLTTSADKANVLRGGILSSNLKDVVYFGDSMNDLECLTLTKGVAISSSPDSSLLKALPRIGFEVHHVNEGREVRQLLWAKDFSEVIQSRALEPLGLLCESPS